MKQGFQKLNNTWWTIMILSKNKTWDQSWNCPDNCFEAVFKLKLQKGIYTEPCSLSHFRRTEFGVQRVQWNWIHQTTVGRNPLERKFWLSDGTPWILEWVVSFKFVRGNNHKNKMSHSSPGLKYDWK